MERLFFSVTRNSATLAGMMLASLLMLPFETHAFFLQDDHPGRRATVDEQAPAKVWVFFHDKGTQSLAKNSGAFQAAASRLTDRAMKRRAKVRAVARLIDETDLDLYRPYLEALKNHGFEVITQSRWLNAVSILATSAEVTRLQALPFVKSVRAVAKLHVPPVSPNLHRDPGARLNGVDHRLPYGNSLTQAEQIRLATLHDAGIIGQGVIVGVLDSGFRWREHEAFNHLTVLAEHDFVRGDDVTSNQPGDNPSQDNHGTQTLSTIGAFKPGALIGPAFGAQYLLAKTENISTETNAEEDYWVQGIEWMEAQGVDVTSTSLGYSTFDAGQRSYTPQDMDGKTAIITIAAEIAVSKGIVVVTSAGNEGDVPSWRIITAPADGPSVLAVGAVFAGGSLVNFSSRGPTADGRIKPDVMAMGSGVLAVNPVSSSEYSFVSGTSFSCPIVAGVVAQILSAHPYLTPAEIITSLKQTANQAQTPNNDFGYGIINAKAAITSFGPAFSNFAEVDTIQAGLLDVVIRILSRDGIDPASVTINYADNSSSSFSARTMTQRDSISYFAQIPRPLSMNTSIKMFFTANDLGFGSVRHPRAEDDFVVVSVKDAGRSPFEPESVPKVFALEQSMPNPFRLSSGQSATTIGFALTQTTPVRLEIFNILGQRVRTLLDDSRSPGRYQIAWDGFSDGGFRVTTGVYFYVMTTPNFVDRKRLLLLR